MRTRPLGTTGLLISELGLGTWGLSGEAYGPVPTIEAERVIERALAYGITLFETADSYGNGEMERLLGKHVAPHKNTVLVTKLGTDRAAPLPVKRFDRAFMLESFERSCERLRRDPMDLVLLHNPSEKTLANEEATSLLKELVEQKRLRAWGVSVGSTAVAQLAMERGAQVLSLPHNALHTHILQELHSVLQAAPIGILAHSVLAYGMLCGQWPQNKEFAHDDHRSARWTPDELRRRIQQLNALRPSLNPQVTTLRAVALRFVLSEARVNSAILGPRSTLQLDQLVREAGQEPYLEPTVLEALKARLTALGSPG